jgi:fructose-specific component phosphotransferase system IIB-like protein
VLKPSITSKRLQEIERIEDLLRTLANEYKEDFAQQPNALDYVFDKDFQATFNREKGVSEQAVNKQDYLAVLRAGIWKNHQCGVVWLETVHVDEVVNGKTIWSGDVEVFNLMQHPKAKRCYAWAHADGGYVAILELSPVDSALAAVQASLRADRFAEEVKAANARYGLKRSPRWSLFWLPLRSPAGRFLVSPPFRAKRVLAFSWHLSTKKSALIQ